MAMLYACMEVYSLVDVSVLKTPVICPSVCSLNTVSSYCIQLITAMMLFVLTDVAREEFTCTDTPSTPIRSSSRRLGGMSSGEAISGGSVL